MAYLTFETGRGWDKVFIEPETLRHILLTARLVLKNTERVHGLSPLDANALQRIERLEWKFFNDPQRSV